MKIVNSVWNWILFAIHLLLGIFFVLWFRFAGIRQPDALTPTLYDVILNVNKFTGSATAGTKEAWGVTIGAIEYLIVIFFFITSFFHLIYATDVFGTGLYSQAIENGNNWLRWIEYGITATIMIFIIALISGVKDFSFVVILLCTFPFLMLQGQIVERAVKSINDTSNDLTNILIPTLTGWAILLGSFGLIIRAFTQRVNEVQNAGYTVPAWLYFVLYPMLIWFASFGVVQIVQIFQTAKGKSNYQRYEKAYLLLSLLSKAFLGAFIGYGLTQRNMQ